MLSKLPENFSSVIIGATGGIGSALADQIERAPHSGEVIRLSRHSQPSIDLRDEASIRSAAQILRQRSISPRLLIIATGILSAPNGDPPEKSLSKLDPWVMRDLMETNAIGPALVLKHFTPLLPREGRSVVAALSARVGSIGDNRLGGWYSYRASKAALNQFVHTTAIELSRTHKDNVCVALHPGTIETNLSALLARGNFTHSAQACAKNLLTVLDGLRPDQTGGFIDYSGAEIPW